jgi:hypothetical protein
MPEQQNNCGQHHQGWERQGLVVCIRGEQVDKAGLSTFAVTTFLQVKWDSED